GLELGSWSAGAAATGASATGADATGAAAVGVVAVGAFALGAATGGAIALGRLSVERGRFKRLRIDELDVGRLRVADLEVERQTGAPHGPLELVRALAQLTLDLGPSALHATLGPVAGGVPPPLELAQVRANPALEPLDLAARGIRLHERLHRLDDVVTRRQR